MAGAAIDIGLVPERVLIVGSGSMGARHARVLRSLHPDCEIALLRHRHGALPDERFDHTMSNLEEALAFKPEAAVVASPANKHLEVALPLARAGVHLLVEKPISATAKGVSELIDVCHAQGVVLMTGYNLRYLKSLQRFRELIGKEYVGRIQSVRVEVGQYLPDWRPDVDYRESVSANKALGGGVLLELSHEIDYLRWIFGEIDKVRATLGNHGDLQIDVEDTAHLLLWFQAERNLVAAVNMDFIRHDTVRMCTAIGTTGSLRWDGIADTVSTISREESAWREVFNQQSNRDDSYCSEWRNFIDAITAGVQPRVSGHDGLAAMRIVDAARSSSEQGIQISIASGDEHVGGAVSVGGRCESL